MASGPSNSSHNKNGDKKQSRSIQNNNNNQQNSKKKTKTKVSENDKSNSQIRVVKIDELKIDPEYKALVPRPTPAEFNLMKESIATQGQLDPIDLDEQKVVVDGHTRYDILKELGISLVKVRIQHFSSKKEEKEFVIDRARLRRNLSPIQKVRLAIPELLEEEEKSILRQKLGRAKETLGSNDPEVIVNGKSRDIVASKYALSGTILQRGRYVLDHADQNQLSSLENGETTISGLFTKLKSKERGESSTSKDNFKTHGVYTPQECPICHRAFAKHELKPIRIRVCNECSTKELS